LLWVLAFANLAVYVTAMAVDGGVKGFAEIRLPSGEIVQAGLHWYEATGIGKRELKIKAFI
jgi:hypothetical protein